MSESWYINIEDVKTDYVKVENIKQWLVDVPLLHPSHPNYKVFWSKQTKNCIEGVWGNEWGKHRFMPGNMYYCINYTVLEHTLPDKSTVHMKPIPVDFMWDYAYMSLISRGFAGFSKDDVYSCADALKTYNEGGLDIKYLPKHCFNKEGELKEYIDAWDYLYQLHDEPLGKPVYDDNPAKDAMVMGSRGSMKSFWVALAELEYNFVFAGAKVYNIDFINQELTSSQCAGSSDTDKSSELLSKLEFSLNAKTDHSNKNFVKWFGIWGKQEEPDFAPCPFYRRTLGNFNCPNKKNPFRHQYKVEINGQWKTKGTNSKIFHVNYSTKKGDGAQAAVGGRYVFSVVEEVGLSADFISVKTANDSTTARAGLKFGVQWAMGTSGNIQYVQAAKKVFLNPQDYGIINFYNQFGAEGKERRIAYFIPYYMTILQFKDENGNTDYKSAIDYVNRQRRIYSGSKDPKVLREEMMNRPCKVEEMWLTDLGYYLPYEEATVRERELMTNNYYKTIGTPIDLHWDNTEPKGVGYKIAHNAEPHYNFPIPKDMKDPSGTPMIYEFPPDSFPNDMFSFVGYDNYVEENLNAGGSLGVTYILKNPKYITQGETGNIIVASYIGKPSKGLDYYHEQQEKLLALYGNPIQGLWFEKNRGDAVREYYIRKHKTYLLCHTPQRVTTSNIYQRTMQSYGFVIGNKISKIANLKLLHDWLLEETTFTVNDITETKLNIQRIPCIFLIRQIMQYTLDDNFDAVSAMLGCIIGLRENQNLEEDIRRSNSNKKNIFAGILNNKKIYRNARLTR